MNENNRIDIYTIPPNFAEEGTILSGRVKTRNAFETGTDSRGIGAAYYVTECYGKDKTIHRHDSPGAGYNPGYPGSSGRKSICIYRKLFQIFKAPP